ncbi:hypothetical protein ACFQY4_36800 [Catellatospora bangladeshensis]
MTQALGILRAIGDRGSEATACFNLAVMLMRIARVDDALIHLRRAVKLAEQGMHPEIGRMRAFLSQLQQVMKERR